MRLVRNAVAGAIAGAGGTAALDALQYARYRRGGGKDGLWHWESAAGVMSWDEVSAPGQLARKALHELAGNAPPEEWARPATNIVHWATGIGWGLLYGALVSTTSRRPLALALALGPTVWHSSYVVLPLAHVYKPIWQYDARTLGEDLSGHLVYGAVTSIAFAALTTDES
jgi:hypothetical protein